MINVLIDLEVRNGYWNAMAALIICLTHKFLQDFFQDAYRELRWRYTS